MVGILVSFWDGQFSGAMLVFGSVPLQGTNPYPYIPNGKTRKIIIDHHRLKSVGWELGYGLVLRRVEGCPPSQVVITRMTCYFEAPGSQPKPSCATSGKGDNPKYIEYGQNGRLFGPKSGKFVKITFWIPGA